MTFSIIKHIDVHDPQSWESKLFLTFDIDWANDDVLNDSIDLVEQYDIPATWFITHETVVLERLRANPKFELGIHPNFNFLLSGDFQKGSTAREVIQRMLDIVPEAKSVRSHSMTQNSNILQIFMDLGLTHDCNHFIPEQTEVELKPWFLWNDLIKAPYFWEDDVACMYEKNTKVQDLCSRKGIKIFDFHPIHVFLNTHDLSLYEKTRVFHQDAAQLFIYRNVDSPGARNWLIDLMSKKEAVL